MNYFWNRHNLFYRISASALIILHLVTFGPLKEAWAFSTSSANFALNSATLNSGGASRLANTVNVWQDNLGEPCTGSASSANYILSAGYIPTIQTNIPLLKANIPYQDWQINSSKANAFSLDDYFDNAGAGSLIYSVIGNSNIIVTIDPVTHMVSFSAPSGWSGSEKVRFCAKDNDGNVITSNEVALIVENPATPSPPLIIEADLDPALIHTNDLVTLKVKALNSGQDSITFTYSNFFQETSNYKEGNLAVSQASWQTDASSKGHYTIKVTASNASGLSDSVNVLVNIGSTNHAPVLGAIPDITVNEKDLAVINASAYASDADNDPLTYYFSAPFDATGKWQPGYNDARPTPYVITVTAFDGTDTVSTNVNVKVNNVDQPPTISLVASEYTIEPNKLIFLTLSGDDPDKNDPYYKESSLTFEIKNGSQVIDSGSIVPGQNHTSSVSFPDEGYYAINATVKDSQGQVATASINVQVTTRKSAQAVMGDFNGDSLTDLGMHDSKTGNWEVGLSQGGKFQGVTLWLSNFGASPDVIPIGGDFNGDGKTDVGIYNPTTGELKIALSTGSSFHDSGTWLTVNFASPSWQAFTGNFNGDKYTDFALYNKDTGEVRVFLGTGSGFAPYTTWINNFGNNYVAMSGDFNGDGLSDLCLFNKSSGEFKVAFSNTYSFVDGKTWISGFANDKDAIISDFNNDGLADIGYWDKSTNNWYYAISTGDKFVDKGIWLNNFGSGTASSGTTGDFDGDGITDAATFDADGLGLNRWSVYRWNQYENNIITKKPADLLTDIDNGIGGKTQISYTYAPKNGNLPFPVYVASSISLLNNIPANNPQQVYSQNFNFYDGYFDAGEREFRGFSKVRVTDPITNNYSETYFYQARKDKTGDDAEGALKGQIKQILSFDGNGNQISQAVNTYEVKKSGPQDKFLGFPALIAQTTTAWEENGSSVTTKDGYTYDNIGNLIQQDDYAGQTVPQKTTATIYAQSYQGGFNRPLQTVLKDKDGNIAARKDFEYDSVTGNLTKETAWLDTQPPEQQPTTQYTYDSFGNVTSVTNALGRQATTNYESDFYTFPKTVTNALGQTVIYEYDPGLGKAKSVTDANGHTSTTKYDSLGRVTEVWNSLYNQPLTTYSYPDFNTKITTDAYNLSKTDYIDGLGRQYKTVSSGDDGGNPRNVSSETFFNNRGLVESESMPHYIDEDAANIAYTRYEYDLRGRVTKTIADFPGEGKDAQSSIEYNSPLYSITTDPNGNRKGALKDVFGNIIEVREFSAGGGIEGYKTDYQYDLKNNLIKTTDSKGNISQIYYDSLGRKTKMVDADMGTWNYEYDVLGNLKKQTDAKGQVLEFTYDELNRLTQKKGLSPQGTVPITLATYQYDDSGKSNCIGRLSKITDLSGSTEFFYDDLGREIKSTKTVNGTLYTVERTYDIAGRLTSLKYPDTETVNYGYNANSGLLESVKGLSPQGTVPYVQGITYNAKGQIKNIQYGNGVTTAYTYGNDLRLSQILTQNTGGAVLQNLNYDFDKNGNLQQLTDNLRQNIRTYSYDDLNRLTAANNVPLPDGSFGNCSYKYDSIGNMLEKTEGGATLVMSYGQNAGPHAVTSAGGYTYQYDANGNMITNKNKTLDYDAENRLVKVNDNGILSTFVYDGDGGRVRKTTKGLSPQGTVPEESTTYIGSLFESDSNGTVRKHIFAGANRVCTEGLSPQGTVPNISYYHTDHLGSSNVITDQNGNQAQYYEYLPYGGLAKGLSPQGTVTAKYLFTGKELDATGLYFYGARYYDPNIGRFITPDTLVQAPYDPQSLNRYSYCRNNPINYVDPTGHKWSWSKFWHAAVGVLVGVVATMVLGPGGAIGWYGWTMASAIGGAMGGAITGGLEGGWKGALIGAAMGGALGGIGGWGVSNYGSGFAAGMLVAGTGLAGATNSWDAYAGGFVGGIVGAAVGGGINNFVNAGRLEQGPSSPGRPTNGPDGEAKNALNIDKKPDVNDPIINNKNVRSEMDRAWNESNPGSSFNPNRHEQGGWITSDSKGDLNVQRWPQGTSSSMTPPSPPPNAVAGFHTHPNTGEGWLPSPSPQDISFTTNSGVDHYVVSESEIYGIDHRTGNIWDAATR